MILRSCIRRKLVPLIVAFALAVAPAFHGCRVRDEAAEPVFELSDIPGERGAKAKGGAKETEEPAKSEIPRPSVFQASAYAEKFLENLKIFSVENGHGELHAVRLGSLVLAPGESLTGGKIKERGSGWTASYICEITDSGLGAWSVDAEAGTALPFPAIRKTAERLGEEVGLIGRSADRHCLAVKTSVAATSTPPADGAPLGGSGRFFLLDRPPMPDFAPMLVIDREGALLGVAAPRGVHGLMAVLPPSELQLLLTRRPEEWRGRYPQPEAKAALENEAPPVKEQVKPEEKETQAKPPSEVRQTESPASAPTRASETLLLGVQVRTLTPELVESFGIGGDRKGVLVTKVHPGTPAERAGLRPGDLIVGLGKKAVATSADLPPLMAEARAGEALPVDLLRGEKKLSLKITPASRSQEAPEKK